MRLADAASFFDKVVCQDAYNGAAATFLAQLDLFDDSKRDGATVARRVLSVSPSVTLPARGAVTAHGDVYVLGGEHKDSFKGNVVRRKFVAHRAEGLGAIKTLEQAILGSAGTPAYGARVWVKDMKQVDTSSELRALFDLYFAAGEPLAVGAVVSLDGRLHLVRNTYLSTAGFRLGEADELPDTTLASIAYTRSGGSYDAVNDVIGSSAPVTVPALWHKFQTAFEYLRPSAETFRPGDITVNVSKAGVAAAGAGDTLTLLGDTWRVVDVRDNGANVWMLHCRRV